jgi:hypothetical protein
VEAEDGGFRSGGHGGRWSGPRVFR